MDDLASFELTYELPEGEHNSDQLEEAVSLAGYPEASLLLEFGGRLRVQVDINIEDGPLEIVVASKLILDKLPMGTDFVALQIFKADFRNLAMCHLNR